MGKSKESIGLFFAISYLPGHHAYKHRGKDHTETGEGFALTDTVVACDNSVTFFLLQKLTERGLVPHCDA
jgi:hypothetical protein